MSSRPGSSANIQPPRTIRQTLVRIVLACVLPAWLGIAVLIVGMYKVLGERTPEGALMTSQALALAVARELAIAQRALEVLAGSATLAAGDLPAFRDRASEFRNSFAFHSVVLSERTGQQIVNTLIPTAAELPVNTTAADDEIVFRTGKPRISNLFKGNLTRLPLVAIKVPVVREGKVAYVLTANISPEPLSRLLADQGLPPGWVVSIFDAARTIVARTHDPQRYIGRKGSPDLMEAMARERAGIVRSITLEGFTVYAAFSRSDASNWSVAIGIPAALVTDRLYQFLSLGAAGGFVVLGAGLVLAGYHSRKIAAGVRSLVRVTTEPVDAAHACAPASDIQEIDEVARRLNAATIALQRRTDERDRAERDKDVAETAARIKGEFIATVSHELRTPLTAITASLDLIGEELVPAVDRETKELLDIARANSHRLHRLVNDILDIEKLEAGKMEFHLERVAVRPLLEQTIATNRALAERNGVALRLDSPEIGHVLADKDRLIQVVANLLSNAIKFSPRDSEVVVSTEQRDGKVRISVRDHGPGVPEHFKGQIFEKFAQADNSDARQRGGTGLGLSIVKEIVQQFGGGVGFTDAPGGGAVFFCDLPNFDPARAPDRPILLCAGDHGTIGSVREWFRHEGYRVDWSQTAEDAVDRANETAYGLVLVDLQLVDADGVSLIHKIRRIPEHAHTPLVVLCNSYDEGRAEGDLATLNIFDWPENPLSAQQLRGRIEEALGSAAVRPARILHLDDDPRVLDALASQTDETVVSVTSTDEARAALATENFDLAIVDLDLDSGCGLEILPHLHDDDGKSVPVIVYSSQGAEGAQAAQTMPTSGKSRTLIENLVRLLRVHVAKGRRQASREPEPA